MVVGNVDINYVHHESVLGFPKLRIIFRNIALFSRDHGDTEGIAMQKI